MSKKYVVMFSGGIGSWAAAKRLVEEHGSSNVTLLFSDVKGDSIDPHVGEDEDTYRFIDDAVKNLGCEFVRVADGRDIWQVFKDKRYLGNSRQANCSHVLKQQPARKWLKENTTPETHVIAIGIDWTETNRRPAIVKAYHPYEVVFPMCEKPYLSKDAMISMLENDGIKPPRLYSLGFSHNNCGGGCVRAGQGQFKHLLDVMPERFARWEQGEKEVQNHIGKNVTILKKQSSGVVRPLSLTDLRNNYKSIDELDLGGCGCFVDGESMLLGADA